MIVNFKLKLLPLRKKLQEHKIYKSIKSIEDIRLFMEQHVFAVWDFMSLLKQLQNQLSCTKVPWLPSGNPEAARLINEIVWGEESDLNRKGIAMSHFEMYLESMQSLGARSQAISELQHLLKKGQTIDQAIDQINLPQHILSFLKFTFEVINTKKNHIIAAVFTFGREDLIPDMFIEIIKNLKVPEGEDLSDLIYYFKRHIEVDADEHGPMALKMVTNLCEDNVDKITEALAYSKKALELRIDLWDGILKEIEKPILV
tara:strand:- start:244 stop:1017 length:774 start_codon:yes stop_codon:yes gene_type:complete